jgi:hypothetical protein
MAVFQFEFSRDDRRKLGGGEDYESNDFFAVVSASGGRQHRGYFLDGALGNQVLISGVKTLGVTFAGCT